MATTKSGPKEEPGPATSAPSSPGRSQWLKGVLEICLLSIVSQGEVYGYEVAQRLTAAGVGEIKGGTLYPRLAALEKADLVETEWRIGDNGPGRKYYRITTAGLTILEESRVEYQRFASAVDGLLSKPPKKHITDQADSASKVIST